LLVKIHLSAFLILTSFKSSLIANPGSQVDVKYVSLTGLNPTRFSLLTIGSKGFDSLSCKGNPEVRLSTPGDVPKQ
jgi:hypothetical protein